MSLDVVGHVYSRYLLPVLGVRITAILFFIYTQCLLISNHLRVHYVPRVFNVIINYIVGNAVLSDYVDQCVEVIAITTKERANFDPTVYETQRIVVDSEGEGSDHLLFDDIRSDLDKLENMVTNKEGDWRTEAKRMNKDLKITLDALTKAADRGCTTPSGLSQDMTDEKTAQSVSRALTVFFLKKHLELIMNYGKLRMDDVTGNDEHKEKP